MKFLILLFMLTLSISAFAQSKGKSKVFISPDNELVIEIYGEAGKKTDKFFKPIKKPLSKNLLRAGLNVRERKGIRAGLRKGVRVGASVRANDSVPYGVRAGVRIGVREQNVKLGVRVGLRETSKAMVRARENSVRMARRAGIRETMQTIMNIRANGVRENNSIVYRMVFKNVDALPSYPKTGTVSVEKLSSNSLTIDFDPTLSKTMQDLKGLKIENTRVECYSDNLCQMIFEL